MSAVESSQSPLKPSLEVLIVGAGFGGIAAAVELRRHGFTTSAILEKAPDLGGTWFHNSYPGAACDVPSHLYSFSFAQRRDWSRLCRRARDPRYLRTWRVDHGVDSLIETGVSVTSARGTSQRCRWTLETAARRGLRGRRRDPRHRAVAPAGEPPDRGRRVVRGSQLPLRRMGPRLRARGQARRRRWHGRQRGSVRTRDRSAGKRLSVFQRTANWFLPRRNLRYPPLCATRSGCSRACRRCAAGSGSSTASR